MKNATPEGTRHNMAHSLFSGDFTGAVDLGFRASGEGGMFRSSIAFSNGDATNDIPIARHLWAPIMNCFESRDRGK
jgi:hypothetical protein